MTVQVDTLPRPPKGASEQTSLKMQVKSLINRTLYGFKTLVWISLTVAVVGLICMFGISYGFFRPVIGFSVMLLFEACAFVLAVLAVTRTRTVKADNDLFWEADEALISKFDTCLGSYSFASFFMILSAVLLSLPLIIFGDSYSVLSFQSYRTIFLSLCTQNYYCILK